MATKSQLFSELYQRLFQWRDRCDYYTAKSLDPGIDDRDVAVMLSDYLVPLGGLILRVQALDSPGQSATDAWDYAGTIGVEANAVILSITATGNLLAGSTPRGHSYSGTFPWGSTYVIFPVGAPTDALRSALASDAAAIDALLTNIPSAVTGQ